MYRKCERGFSFVEFMMVATVLSFATTGVKTFVFDRGKEQPTQIASNQMAEQGRASLELMVHELELASGSPEIARVDPTLLPDQPETIKAPFLVADPDHVVFEADLEGDGAAERVEYRLWNSAIWRRVVPVKQDDTAAPAEYELLTEYVDNGDLPLFQYDRDPLTSFDQPTNISKVWVTLQLRPPAENTKRPQFRTMRFDGLAERHVTTDGVAVAGLK